MGLFYKTSAFLPKSHNQLDNECQSGKKQTTRLEKTIKISEQQKRVM